MSFLGYPKARISREMVMGLFQTYEAADNRWQVMLEHHFKAAASERRYDADKSGHPEACRTLHAKVVAAREAYLTAMVQLPGNEDMAKAPEAEAA